MAYVNLNADTMTVEQAQDVIQALKTKGVRLPCPRCGYAHFTLLEGFFSQPISGNLAASGTMAFSQGPTVPSVVTACGRCGFLSQHALGALGLGPGFSPGYSFGAGINKIAR
jgi:hypothetical protein